MAKYRVGVIGLGRIASTIDDEVHGYSPILLPYSHTAAYMEVSDVEVVAGADIDPEKCKAYKERWGVEQVYRDYHQMLADEDLDIVSVCTRTRERPQIVIDCARAGVKAIFAEKPMAFSLREARAMIEACNENNVKLAIGCLRRWDPWINRAHELIDDDMLGDIRQITAYASANISHNGSHALDTVRYFASDARALWVAGEVESDEKAQTDYDVMGNAYIAFENGIRAYVRMMPCGAANWEFEIIGEKGRLRSLYNGAEWELWLLQAAPRRPMPVRHIFPRPQRIESATVRAVKDLIDCIETGKQPNCSGEDGYAALELAIALRESHRHGGIRMPLPLTNLELQIITDK